MPRVRARLSAIQSRRLRPLAGDAPTYVSRLEETVIRTLAGLGVAAHTDPGNRGVFAEGGKIAAIGVAVTHGVTMHGSALNVCPGPGALCVDRPMRHRATGGHERREPTGVRRPGRQPRTSRLLVEQFAVVFERIVVQGPIASGRSWMARGIIGRHPARPKSD